MNERKVWFITGASSGLGREIAKAALARGENVVATARSPEVLKDLVATYPETVRAIRLDVTDPPQVAASVWEAVEEFGRIDVLVNNAGYGLVGAIEEASAEQVKQQFETNVFGVLNVTREVLPTMRKQKHGHIVIIGSMVGFGAPASFGHYAATKFALEGLAEALASEVRPLGIATTIVEPGAFNTGYSSRALVFGENLAPEVYPATEAMRQAFAHVDGPNAGDPAKAAEIIVSAVNSADPPFRLPVGGDAYETIENKLERMRREIAVWRDRATKTQFEQARAVQKKRS